MLQKVSYGQQQLKNAQKTLKMLVQGLWGPVASGRCIKKIVLTKNSDSSPQNWSRMRVPVNKNHFLTQRKS